MAAETPSGRGRKRAVVEGEFAQGAGVGTALIAGNAFGIKAVRYTVVDGHCIVEGDINLGTEAEVAQQNDVLQQALSGELAASVAISGNQFRWPNCRVPFTIDPALPDQARVTNAIAHWESKTQFRFVPKGPADTDFVTFRPGTGCSSSVGRRGGQQFVNLAAGCGLGNVIHEIGHTIGLWHEQSREDRDQFVTIHLDKVQPGMEHNFDQHISDGDDIGPYDYGSIMHYPRNAFSKDGSDTITPKDPTAQIGQRTALSPGDIAAANSMCPKIFKEAIKDRKEPLKDIKEGPKDPLRDTVRETVKEPLKDRKEPIKDFKEPIKEFREPPVGKRFLEPPIGKGFREPTGPLVPGQVLQPGVLGGLGGGLPFALATGRQADFGDQYGGFDVGALAGELDALGAALGEAQQYVAALGQQYEALASALQQTLDALGYQ